MLIDLSKRLSKDLLIGVIDYEKAFDLIEHTVVFNSMREQGVNDHPEHI